MQLTTSFTELSNGKDGSLGFGDYTNIVIAAVPFIMVAVVELTKIPFVDAFIKPVIEFGKRYSHIAGDLQGSHSSALNGFERNFNALNIGVDRLQNNYLWLKNPWSPFKRGLGELKN